MTTTEYKEDTHGNLANDIKTVITEAETLLDSTNQLGSKQYQSARAKLKTALDTAKIELPRVTQKAVEKTKHAAHVTHEYVGDNPWKAVGLAAAIGLLAGLVIGRSK